MRRSPLSRRSNFNPLTALPKLSRVGFYEECMLKANLNCIQWVYQNDTSFLPFQVMMAGGGWGKLLLDRPPNQIMLEAQKYVRERLARKWLPLFVMTEAFQERQRPHIKMEDVVDDVMASKRKRYMAIYKVKYLSS